MWRASVGSYYDCTEQGFVNVLYLNEDTIENKGNETFGIIKIKINVKLKCLLGVIQRLYKLRITHANF